MDWQLRIGYRGLASHVWREEWQCCVREDKLATRRRFKVYEFNFEVGRFDTLGEAKTFALRRLIALAKRS